MDIRGIKPRQLEAFRATMMSGSVTRAAGLLHISQPAVSQLLHELERRCGFPLFERRQNRLIPTQEAAVLYNEVQRMFGAIDRVARVAAALKVGSWGQLRVAGFPAFAARCLPEIVIEYRKTRPGVSASIESRRSRSLIDWLATQQLDFGLGVMPSDRADVKSVKVSSFDALCVMPLDHPLANKTSLSLSDFAGQDVVSVGREDVSGISIDMAFEIHRVPRKVVYVAPQSDIACALVAEGAGIALVDPFSAYNASGRVAVRRVHYAPTLDVWALFPQAIEEKAQRDPFLECVKSYLERFSVKAGQSVPFLP